MSSAADRRAVDDVLVVVRAAEERTEARCVEIVAAQVSEGAVVVVREQPFAAAHLRSIEVAAASGSRWSLFLDADVLLRPGCVEAMVREASDRFAREAFHMLNLRVADRGFGGPAFAGVHLYATASVRASLDVAAVAEGADRPETEMNFAMARRGAPTLRSAQVVGLHGYEQYLRDSYRTAWVRALKFRERLPYLLERHAAASFDDPESRVLLWGTIDGVRHADRGALLDSREYRDPAAELLARLGLTERDPLTGPVDVDAMIDAATPDAAYRANRHWISPEGDRAFASLDRSRPSKLRRGAARAARAIRVLRSGST